jgi:two-component system sensor histidine kinase ChvG
MALESERSEEYALPPRALAGSRRAADGARSGRGQSGAAADPAADPATGAATGAIRAIGNTIGRTLGGTRDAASGLKDAASGLAERISRSSEGPIPDTIRGAAGATWAALVRWFKRQPVVRFVAGSLLRRILVSNLLGFSIFLIGILYLGWVNTWLIDAKVDALTSQGKIIADAIAANATIVRESIVVDPKKLAGEQEQPRVTDDGLEDLELSIHPEEVTPIVRKLIQPTNTRARIYTRDGTLIIDTSRSLASLTAGMHHLQPQSAAHKKPQNFWTKLTRYLFKEPLPIYQEIDDANGLAYPEVREVITGKERSMLLLNKKGEQIVSVAVPIRRFNQVQGVLLLSTRPGQIDKILREERRVILVLAAIALLASVVTSLLLARTVAGPMRRLSAAADQLSRNIAAREQLPALSGRSDEVGQMAGAFQAMTNALYRRIEASEKFAADVAHELKNPLTAARSTAEALGYAKNDAERDHLVQQIQGELKRLNRLITDVSNASRLDAELARKEMRPVDLPLLLHNVVAIFRDILGDDSRKVVLADNREPHPGAFTVDGDEGRLGQVITNLVDNAISFSPEGATVTVGLRNALRTVEIVVEDEGPGIPADRLDIIFDRFYSDRPATDTSRGKNSGLGLSISREIIHAHGGEIIAQNRYDAGDNKERPTGARFIVRLPVAAQTQRGGSASGRRI